ncbi:multiprotein-bridging factor 1 family protein [Candidatus Omnitrophota bacterium]
MSKSLFDPTYPDHPSTFGQYLRKVRMDAGFEIKELASAANLNEMTIINWEKGRTKPMLDKLANLTHVLENCGCNNLSGLSQYVLTYPNIHINYNNKIK